MSAPFIAKNDAIFNPRSPFFWKKHPDRTAFLLPPDGWDPLCWDVQAFDLPEVTHRTRILEAIGFVRNVLARRRGHCGQRKMPIDIEAIFIHREALEYGEEFARALTIFDQGDYIMPGFRHLSAYEFWLRYPQERPAKFSDLAGWERRRKPQLDQPVAAENSPTQVDQRLARKLAVQRTRRLRLATDHEWIAANAVRAAPSRLPSGRARLPDARILADRLATQLREVV